MSFFIEGGGGDCGNNLVYGSLLFKRIMASHCNSGNKSMAVPLERWETYTDWENKCVQTDDWLLILDEGVFIDGGTEKFSLQKPHDPPTHNASTEERSTSSHSMQYKKQTLKDLYTKAHV